MPRARRASTKRKGPRQVAYELIGDDTAIGRPIYKLCRELVLAHHDQIAEANIAIAWNKSWKPDVDGRLTLGKLKKATDLDRELSKFDFIILLNRAFWIDKAVSAEQRAALLDHELCHAEVKLDARTDDPVVDERGRKVYRTRKHDIEEFTEIVARHGIWKHDIEQFGRALFANVGTYKGCDVCKDSPGYVNVTDSVGTRVQRCECWHEHRERALEAARIKEGARQEA